MIIPVRCFTCGKVIGDKWTKYQELVNSEQREPTVLDITYIKEKTEEHQETPEAKAFNLLGIDRYCCRRHFLGQVDLLQEI